MFTVKIDKKKYKVPYKQSELTHSMGIVLEDLKEEYSGNTDNVEFQKWFLAILAKVDYDLADMIDEKWLSIFVKGHSFFLPIQLRFFPKILKVNKKLYEYHNFDKVTVRLFGEMDIKSSEKDFKNLYLLLYHPMKVKWYNSFFKKTSYKNFKSFEAVNHYHFYLAIYSYLDYMKKILNLYKLNAVHPDIPAEQQPDEWVQTPLEKWGMYKVVMDVCGNNYSEFEKWLDRDIHELLKFVKYQQLVALENHS